MSYKMDVRTRQIACLRRTAEAFRRVSAVTAVAVDSSRRTCAVAAEAVARSEQLRSKVTELLQRLRGHAPRS